MTNIVDFYKDNEDGSFVYKCTLRGEIRVAKFEEMKLWLEKKKAWGRCFKICTASFLKTNRSAQLN